MPEQKVNSTITILYFAFLSSTLLYLIVGFILYKSGWKPIVTDRNLQLILSLLFALISVTVLYLTVSLKQKAFSGSGIQQNLKLDFSKYVVSRTVPLFALSEIPAILGLIHFFLAGNLIILVAFCVLSLICFSVARPNDEMLSRLESNFTRL
jgi:hypothetical protein